MSETAEIFRLREISGKRQRTFVLRAGEHRVGSAEGNEIHLDDRGVSRRHAVLRVRAGGGEVEDLDSKNGTRVRGQRIEREELQPGDEVAFGPVALVFETADAEDAELAVEVDPPSLDPGDLRAPRHTTHRLEPEPGLGAPLQLLQGFLDRWLMPPEGDPRGALEALARGTRAAGACFARWPRDEAPVILSASGQLGELPSASAVEQACAGEGPPVRQACDVGSRCVAFVVPGVAGAVGFVLASPDPAALGDPVLPLLALLTDRLEVGPVARLDHWDSEGGGETGDASRQSSPLPAVDLPEGIVAATSTPMVGLYEQLRALGQGPVPVLVLGETGVGKEHIAQTLHRMSDRRDGPLVALNCAALPDELLEAELFGIGKAVATGVAARPGKFRQAEGGTLFLDEVGELAPVLQAKLLRVLQEGEVTPLGERPVPVDVRVVSATNLPQKALQADDGFRTDLYYRLAGFVLHVPPLRERKEDIPALVGHFIRRYSRETHKTVRGLTVKALRELLARDWPGNVRELEHEIRRLVYLCPHGQAIGTSLLDAGSARPGSQVPGPWDVLAESLELGDQSLASHLESLERRLVERALEQTGGNRSATARLLQVSRNGLTKRLKRLGIDPRE